jgi:amino acid transporter
MKSIIILAIIVLVTVTLVASPKITFKPFSITLTNGWFALGISLLGLGIGFIRYQGYKDGEKAGIKSTFEYLKETIKQQEQ